jgi:hypothetical protein
MSPYLNARDLHLEKKNPIPKPLLDATSFGVFYVRSHLVLGTLVLSPRTPC